MNKKIAVLILTILACLCFPCIAQTNKCSDAHAAIEDIKTSIVNGNIQKLCSHINEGIYVDDVPNNRKKTLSLLKNKNGWLHKYIFERKDSLKSLLSQQLSAVKTQRVQIETPTWLVNICTNNSDPTCPSFTIMCFGGKWYLTNINSY